MGIINVLEKYWWAILLTVLIIAYLAYTRMTQKFTNAENITAEESQKQINCGYTNYIFGGVPFANNSMPGK